MPGLSRNTWLSPQVEANQSMAADACRRSHAQLVRQQYDMARDVCFQISTELNNRTEPIHLLLERFSPRWGRAAAPFSLLS
jgi:hypothetical protein